MNEGGGLLAFDKAEQEANGRWSAVMLPVALWECSPRERFIWFNEWHFWRNRIPTFGAFAMVSTYFQFHPEFIPYIVMTYNSWLIAILVHHDYYVPSALTEGHGRKDVVTPSIVRICLIASGQIWFVTTTKGERDHVVLCFHNPLKSLWMTRTILHLPRD